MHRRSFLRLAVATAAVASLTMGARAAPPATDADQPTRESVRMSGPWVHENLAVYFVHSAVSAGATPLTLQEAMNRNLVRVHETGSVNELAIENLGDAEIFVQSGDIVKGGKQDRALIASLLLPPRSGRVPIASFCVEQGRWSARGREDVTAFSTADASIPSRRAKLAMRALAPQPATTTIAPDVALLGISPPRADRRGGSEGDRDRRTVTVVGGAGAPNETAQRQQEVWRSVAETQSKLSGSVGAPVAAAQSQSSLQLALENGRLKQRQEAFVAALNPAGETSSDIVGFAFAINGKINSADVYSSNGLFRKMWKKLLDASVTEAIGEREAAAAFAAAPSAADVLAFLREAESAAPTLNVPNADVRLETRDGERAVYVASARADGAIVHRSYVAK